MTADLSAAFADPVAGAQACFRTVLAAMSRPGSVLTVAGVDAPSPLCPAAASVLLTLVDQDTPLWLDPAAQEALPWLCFHTGTTSVAPGSAAFAFALSLPDFGDFPAGTDDAPETGATVILQVRSLGGGRRFSLAGPGLRQPGTLAVEGLPADFAAVWRRNHALFPRGLDLVLCAGDQLAALPRSVSLEDA